MVDLSSSMADEVSTKDATAGDAARRRIEGQGTPEAEWRAWTPLARLPSLTPAELLPATGRVVVVAPHPDDEVLGCGGLLARLARTPRGIMVIGVSDGEASHPHSATYAPGRLGAARRDERDRGLAALGLAHGATRLGFADGGLLTAEAQLAATIEDLLIPEDVVIATWRFDGHPDHEAVGRAAGRAARRRGCALLEMPVWMWHWATPGDARVPWHRMVRVALDAEADAAKRRALAHHRTQIEPDGMRPAVLPGWALDRVTRPFEYFLPEVGSPSRLQVGTAGASS